MGEIVLKSEYQPISPTSLTTLPEYYLERAKFHAHRGKEYYLVDGITNEKRLYSKFDDETKKIASGFNKLGLVKGDVVIFMNRDMIKSVILLVGVWRANGVLRAIFPEDEPETILSRILECRVKFIICEKDAINMCQQFAEKVTWPLKTITVNRSFCENIPSLEEFIEEDDGFGCPELLIEPEDPALILSTSGTTGMPKGAVHTHRSVLYQNRSHERGPFLAHKLNFVLTKATHISGTNCGLTFLAIAKPGIVIPNITLDNVFSVVEKFKPGMLFAFPTLLIPISNAHGKGHDLSSLEVIFTAGAPVTPTMMQSLKQLPNVRDIVPMYGLSEANNVTISAVLKEDDEKNGVIGLRDLPDFSVGKLYPDTKLRVHDLTTHEILGANQTGEICVWSPCLFKEYLNNKEATTNAYIDGYFRTGDLGYFDEAGFIYIVDRIKEIFKFRGYHVSPTELENVVAAHPDVAEVCVVGIPDEEGHVPRAFVTLHATAANVDCLAEEIKNFANDRLASYKSLRGGVHILKVMPKGKTGKVARQTLENFKI